MNQKENTTFDIQTDAISHACSKTKNTCLKRRKRNLTRRPAEEPQSNMSHNKELKNEKTVFTTDHELHSSSKCVLSDDDDLPSPLFPPLLDDKKVFDKDDVVWMKVKNLYTPGVVFQVNKRSKTAKVKCVNSPRRGKPFTKKFCELIDFNNSTRNQSFLDESRKIDPNIKDAYDKIVEYWCSSCNSETPVSAVRYLTTYEGDKKNEIAMFLESNNSELVNADYDTELEDDDMLLDHSKEISNVAPERNSVKPVAYGIQNHDASICKNKNKKKHPNNKEVNYSGHMLPSQDQTEKIHKESLILQDIIEGSQCKNHLKNIIKGNTSSQRHAMFMTQQDFMGINLIQHAGLGPFTNDTGLKLVNTLEKLLDEVDKNNNILKYGRRFDYLFNVLMPEAIIFGLMQLHNLNWKDAEDRFRYFSSQNL